MRDRESPGFLPRTRNGGPHRWKASVSWEHFHHGRNVWSATYLWTLYLDDELVDAVVETACSVAAEDRRTRLRALSRCIHEYRWDRARSHREHRPGRHQSD